METFFLSVPVLPLLSKPKNMKIEFSFEKWQKNDIDAVLYIYVFLFYLIWFEMLIINERIKQKQKKCLAESVYFGPGVLASRVMAWCWNVKWSRLFEMR